MRKKIIFILILLLCILFLLPLSYEYIKNHILYMIENNKIIPFYSYDPDINIKFDLVVKKIENFIEVLKNINFKTIKEFIVEKVFTRENLIIVIYILNVLMLLYIFFDLWASGTNLKYIVSLPARVFTKIMEFLRLEFNKNFKVIKDNFNKILLIFLLSSGWLIIIFFELSLFMFDYIVGLINLKPDVILSNIFKYLVVQISDFILNSNRFIFYNTLLVIIFFIGYFMAWRKLRINWQKVCKLVDGFGTITVINGSPGTGKTLTISQFSLAQEENMIMINEDTISKFEIQHPEINFNYVYLLMKCYFLDLKENEFSDIVKNNPDIFIDLFKYRYILDSDLSRVFFNLYYRGTSICSSYSINDPYFDSFTRKADIQSFRLFKKQDSMFHEIDEIITLSEFDKEFNSHDDIKTVGDDGTAAFFSIFSHLSSRTGKVFIDYQDKDQGIRRIRALAHSFIQLENRKVSMPFIFKLFYKLVSKIFNILVNLMHKYKFQKVKTEKYWTVRNKQHVIKKNKIDLLYTIIKYLSFFFYRMIVYFEKFQYFIISGQMAHNDSFTDPVKIRYRLNVMDFYHNDNEIYRSCQFNKFYADLRDTLSKDRNIKQSLCSMEKWTSLDPDANEYADLHMRFYSKIVQAQYETEKKEAKKKEAEKKEG